MIRTFRVTDALKVRSLTTGLGQELTAPNWPKTPPESKCASASGLLTTSVVPLAAPGRVGVAPSDGHMRGLVVARPRATGLVWDIDHLLTAGSADIAVELLRWACDQALKAGARRVFLETTPEGLGVEVAGRAGFERYTEGEIWVLDRDFSTAREDSIPARPRLRVDETGLFQLYNAAVPAPVRAAEALTYEEWVGLHRGRKPWSPPVFGATEEYVWEIGARTMGWMRIVFGERAQYLTLLIHPQAEAFAERMLADALRQLSPKAPVLTEVRAYQSVTQRAVEATGFKPGHAYIVWVRQLAQRAAEPNRAAVRTQPSPLA